MQSLQETLTRYRAFLEPALQSYLSDPAIPETLRSSMLYSVSAGGKRLRGCLCLAACRLAGSDPARAIPFACALEMIHTYSLIHDDLPCMDNDDYRRGKPTNHKVYGEGNAVLAGDGLLSYAFEIILTAALKSGNHALVDAAAEIASGAGVFGMVAGQSADLANEQNPCRDIDALQFIHNHKTGSLLTASILSGAKVGGASPELLTALKRYGEAYGRLFQITDDLLDVTGDFAHMGKTIGKDAKSDKLTYVTLYGLESAKTLAFKAAEEAVSALNGYQGTEFFTELAEYTLQRDS